MKFSIVLSAAVMALSLSACDRPTVVTTPGSTTVVPVPVPGPAGAPGATGAPGAPGANSKSTDTVVIVPAPEKPASQ